jgi:exodeoxyribonuclease VII large subunit
MPEEVYSVSDLTADIRASLENGFEGVWVEGEISNHRLPGSGHHYFTLKDEFAQLTCVLFRGAAAKNPVTLRDGLQVQAFGNISVYEARGQYQLIAQVIQAKGAGDLQARFEALKKKLEEEGLFDPAKKKPIPLFPRTVGIVTSPTGAAIRDMRNVFARRAPWLRILVHPVRVQGEGAAEEIAAAVRSFDRESGDLRPDLVIVARGGGSIEDLWAFNEEVVARAIADCSLPVMSGVGHEIDFTIADFVADRREPTPSAAAENATPDGESLLRHLDLMRSSLETRLQNRFGQSSRTLDSLHRELQAREPRRRIQSWMQSLDFLKERFESIAEGSITDRRAEVLAAGRVLAAIQPERVLRAGHDQVTQLHARMVEMGERFLELRRRELLAKGDMLHSLSPEAVIQRGFSMTLDDGGRPITKASEVNRGDRIRTRLADGEIESVVE